MSEQTVDISVVAAHLVEAVDHARAGDRENTQARIAHALALLQGKPVAAAQVTAVLSEGRRVSRGGLLRWQRHRLIAHVDANIGRRIPVNELAALFHLSTSHFHRSFKCAFGVTPHHYLSRRRIEVAKGLMLTTQHALSEIALRCGMADQSHLSHWFRRIVGETPHAWRRIRRGAPGEENSDYVAVWGE